MNRDIIIEKLQNKLSKKRFIHSIGVEYMAVCLAIVHGIDIEKARLAGLLHDCGKYLTKEEELAKAKKYNLPINSAEEINPDLLHAKLGAYYAHREYDVSDDEILEAIRCHTTGKPDMSKLDKIIFIADYIEPNRKIIPEIKNIRKEAFCDLDKALLHILKNTLIHLEKRNIAIDHMTQLTYDYYSK